MESVGVVLWAVGLIAGATGGLWLVVVAFQEGALWGLGCVFIPFVGLVFAVLHWEDAARPFLLAVAGGVLMGVGSAMGGPAT